MRPIKKEIRQKALLVGWVLLITGCAIFRQVVRVEKPTATISDVHISHLDFQRVDLSLTVDVSNPNPLGIRMAGFTYDCILEGHPFLSGQKAQTTTIPAKGSVSIPIPLSLSFEAIRPLLGALAEKDSARFSLKTQFTFDLPVIGPYPVSVEKTGHFPLLKPPKIFLSRFQVIRLGWTGAELELGLTIENPNACHFRIGSLHYTLFIQGSPWVTGRLQEAFEIPQKKAHEVALSIGLDFTQIGTTAYTLLQQGKGLDYRLQGELRLSAPIQAMGEAILPIDLTGTIIPKR